MELPSEVVATDSEGDKEPIVHTSSRSLPSTKVGCVLVPFYPKVQLVN